MNGVANPNEHKIKVVFVGDSGVGKSSIIGRFARQEFSIQTKTTVGVEYAVREAEGYIKGTFCHVIMQLWDTAGQERFKAVVTSYFKNALGVVLVYDITKRQTFEDLDKWYGMISENCNEYVSLIVLGNKADLVNLRKVQQTEGWEWAMRHSAAFAETSSFSNYNIDQSLECLLVQIIEKLNLEQPGTADISRYSQTSRASHLSKGGATGDREHTSCC